MSKHLAWAETAAGIWFRYRCQACFVFCMTEYEPVSLTFPLCETDTPKLHARMCGPRIYLLVLWAVVSWFVNALQVLVCFQGLSKSPLLWEEVCVCALCKACHRHWFTKKVHALRSACQHVGIIVMRSIRAKLRFIPIGCLSFHPYWLSHVPHVLFCMRGV